MQNSNLRRTFILGSLLFTVSSWADVPDELKLISQQSNSKDFVKSCESTLNEWIKQLDNLNKMPPGKLADADKILKESFLLRLKIHEHLSNVSIECKKLTQGVFSRLREYEDSVGAHNYNQIKIEEVDYAKVITPVLDHKGYAPYNLNPKYPTFQFEDGDILITKGISPISSTITTFTDHHSPFSHIAFVHVDPAKKQAETIESYIGKGVSFFSMIDAMKNENARILVLRPKDRALAKRAATYMRDRVKGEFSKGSYIPYDYQLDFSNNRTLSCEEVAFDSYKTASNGSFMIPEAPSLIKFQSKDLTSRVGMKKGRMMMPADMEVDSRFEIVLDWTDYRIIRDSWRKDVMMNVALNLNEAGEYDFPENYKTRLVPYIWGLRKNSLLWPLAAKVSGIPEDFTPDVPALSIATMGSFKQIQADHLPNLQKFDEDYFRNHNQWPPKVALFEKMNQSISRYKKKK